MSDLLSCMLRCSHDRPAAGNLIVRSAGLVADYPQAGPPGSSWQAGLQYRSVQTPTPTPLAEGRSGPEIWMMPACGVRMALVRSGLPDPRGVNPVQVAAGGALSSLDAAASLSGAL